MTKIIIDSREISSCLAATVSWQPTSNYPTYPFHAFWRQVGILFSVLGSPRLMTHHQINPLSKVV
jgi:hypothetical protein